MHADPAPRSNPLAHDADSDSLFGSPPPSPRGRGRSPSPLALPGVAGSAQNVGTLALPGSHLVAEASVHPPASSPLSVNDRATSVVPPLRTETAGPSLSQAVRSRPAAGHVAQGGSAVASASRAPAAQRKSKKGKEKARGGSVSRSSTPRPAAPPIPIPSPDQPVPPNFLRNQQALLGVAGLVGGVNPSQLAPQPGTTAGNPIVLDDDDNDRPRSIGRRRLADSTLPPLPPVRGPDILQTLAQQGSALPLVESLVRLLAGTVATTAPPPKLPGRTGWERPSPSEPPPLKRRRLNSVPAGASDWDVPYPFQAGQGPADYQTTWAKERAARLVRELVTLVRDAAKKAAVKGYLQEQQRVRKQKWMDERGWQGRVGGYYKSRASFYGLEDGLLQARARSVVPGTSATPPAASTPRMEPIASGSGSRQTMSEPPSLPLPPLPAAQSPPPTSINQWLASMLANTPPMSQDLGQTDLQSAPSQDATLGPFQGLSSLAEPEGGHDTQYFDDWLALLESIPPGDPNDPAALPDLRNVLDDFASGNGSESTPGMLDMQGQTFDFPNFFDPALLDIPIFPDNSPQAQTFTPDPTIQASAPTCSSHAQTSASLSIPTSVSASSALHREGPAQAAFFAQNHVPTPSRNTSYLSTSVPRQSASATPSLTGSPLASTVSLADTEPSPATPEWGWAFGEPGVVTGSVLDGLNATGANVDGIVVGEAEMKEFEKVLEETCGPLSALSTLQFDQETGCGADRMDVDSVGPDGSAPAIAQPLFEGAEVPDVAMTGVPSTAEPQQGVGAQLVLPDPALLQVQLNGQPPLCVQLNAQDTAPALEQPQWLSAGAPAVSSSNASVQSLPPAVTRAHTEPPATTALPPSLASSDAPGLPASRSSPAPSTASQLSALSSLLALTNASKPASTSRLTRAEVLQRAKAMRRDLERARERARVELWETTVEGACLVGLGRELTKGPGVGDGDGSML